MNEKEGNLILETKLVIGPTRKRVTKNISFKFKLFKVDVHFGMCTYLWVVLGEKSGKFWKWDTWY